MTIPVISSDSRFRLESHDHDGNYLATLPFRNIQGEWMMNDAGQQIRGEIPYRGYAQVTRANLSAGKHELWLFDENVSTADPIFAGPIWDLTTSSDSGIISFTAQDPLSYLVKRVLKTFKAYSGKPEAGITDLISYTNSIRAMNLSASVVTAGTQNISATFLASDRNKIKDLITSLSQMGSKVDYYVRTTGGAHVLRLYGGQIKTTTTRALEYGGLLDGYSVQDNAQTIANDLDVLGPQGLVGNSTSATKITEYDQRYQEVSTQDDASTSLASTAATQLKDTQSSKIIPTIVTRALTPIKDFDFGSQFQIVINDEYEQLNQLVRATGWQYTISSGDLATTAIYTKDTEGVT